MVLRDASHKFRGPIRNRSVSWAAHRASGSPEMLQTIVKAVELGLKAKGK
jgi:hypothetical protein